MGRFWKGMSRNVPVDGLGREFLGGGGFDSVDPTYKYREDMLVYLLCFNDVVYRRRESLRV